MQGVEILTSAQVAIGFAFNWSAFWITFGIIFIILCGAGICSFLFDDLDEGIIPAMSIVGIVFGILFGCLCAEEVCPKPVNYETQYKVTISDEVSMTEFYEHYEVIEQDGKIFTVREKTNESN